MARNAVSDVIKIRKQIIALSQGDFEDLVRDIDVIKEIRDEMAKQKEEKPNGDS